MKFKTGEILFTPYLYSLMLEVNEFKAFILNSINRHSNCDWGDCCEDDNNANEQALYYGSRILSVYNLNKKYNINKQSIWIITEHDRSVTTILFPDEY